jgi:drug/metabolite transporter (DMT)-like permease
MSSRRAIWLAAALPVLWLAQGSTFVALKVGVGDVPPFLLSGARFLLVGLVLLAWAAVRSGGRIGLTRREALLAAATGLGLFAAGQGSASWSSQYLTPGLLAVLISTIPLWSAIFGRLAFGTRIGALGSLGLLFGFAGVAFLAWPGGGSGIAIGPALAAIIGAASWGAAVVVVARTGIGRRAVLVTSVQTLVGGTVQLVIGVAGGEARHLNVSALEASLPAFAWLVVVSSVLGVTLLTWLLSEVRVNVVNTASYVAPVIALALAWLLLGEQISPRTVVGVAVILIGVAAMVWGARPPKQAARHECIRARRLDRLAA